MGPLVLRLASAMNFFILGHLSIAINENISYQDLVQYWAIKLDFFFENNHSTIPMNTDQVSPSFANI